MAAIPPAAPSTQAAPCIPRWCERPRAEWPVLIKDHHEGYITWADYLANEARLAANRTNAGARPPRRGLRAVPGDHLLRVLRQADAHQLPHRCPALL